MHRRSVRKIAPLLTLVLALAFLASCAPSKVELPKPALTKVRFGVATDVHYADIEPRGSRFSAISLVLRVVSLAVS